MKREINKVVYCIIIIILSILFLACENKKPSEKAEKEKISDGIYDASVTTPSGTYDVQVYVSNGEVEYVDWPNGGQMTLTGATIIDKHAEGTNSKGDEIEIDIQ